MMFQTPKQQFHNILEPVITRKWRQSYWSKIPSGTNSNSKAKARKKKKAQQSNFLWSASLFWLIPLFLPPPKVTGESESECACQHWHTPIQTHTHIHRHWKFRVMREQDVAPSPSSQIGERLQLWIGPPCGSQQLIHPLLIPTCVHWMSVCIVQCVSGCECTWV